MSKLTELLDELCPDGVEYLPLGEVAEVLRGRRLTKKSLTDDGPYPVFHGGLDPIGYFESCNRPAHTVMVINVGASAGTVGYSAVDFWSSDGCYCLELAEGIDPRYVFQALKNQERHFFHRVRRAGIPTLDADVISRFTIPIPPLKVQQEIVRVLDAFTDLEQSLVSELELRKKQYEFYRDELLSFTANGGDLCSDEVEYRPLGEVIVLHPGVRITRKNDSGTLYPVYGGGGESFRTDNFNRTNDYVISRFAMSENCVRYVPEEFWLLDSGISFEATPTVLKDYVGHNLMQMQPQIFQCSGKSAQRNLRVKDFLTLTLPVPPLEAQQEIVAKLDTFDSLIQSIEQEISLRRKQYEFYRDELLNFVPKED